MFPQVVFGTKQKAQGDVEVLLKWQQLPPCENNWELASEIQQVFPQFHLEDNIPLERKSIDRTRKSSIKCAYQIRNKNKL